MSDTRPIPWLRLITILTVGFYVQIGPVMTQGLGFETHPAFKTWRMYRTFGRDICRVRFFEHSREGEVTEINRLEVLANENGTVPRYIRFIPNEAQVVRTAKTMCKRLGESTHIQVSGECGTIQTWRPLDSTDQNVCDMSESAIEELDHGNRKPKKKRKKRKKSKIQENAGAPR